MMNIIEIYKEAMDGLSEKIARQHELCRKYYLKDNDEKYSLHAKLENEYREKYSWLVQQVEALTEYAKLN